MAPLHLPGNLLGVERCRARFDVPQVACFDTAFHHTLPEWASRLPIPQALGMRRYGFHGLNYAHIASRLPSLLGEGARGRIVVAHLGSGASLCLLENLRSVDTSMGYTPAGGIPMGTRSGDLDPGVMLELARRYDHVSLSDLVYHQMGLLALSGGRKQRHGGTAGEYQRGGRFCGGVFLPSGARRHRRVCRQGGRHRCAGVQRRDRRARAADPRRICEPLGFLGFSLDAEANRDNRDMIQADGSRPILRMVANEEGMIRELVESLLRAVP